MLNLLVASLGYAIIWPKFLMFTGTISMHFIVHAIDKENALEKRLAIISRHREFLDTGLIKFGVNILMSGPLMSDDGDKMIGSFFLASASGRTQIEAMIAADPLSSADVWERIDVSAVAIRQNNIGPIAESA